MMKENSAAMSTVPMTDLKTQYRRYQNEIDTAMRAVVEETAFVLGKKLEEFEKKFADYCGGKFCVGVANGTDAIGMALDALGVNAGDEVITTPFTFIATVEGILERGAIPKFVDINLRDYCIDTAKISAAISKKTRAIVPVHLYGMHCDMPAIMKIAQQHNLKVMEDTAQAHGAKLNGKRAGSWGEAATFSFYPGKNLGAYGDGGAVVCSDEKIVHRLKLLRNHGRLARYVHECVGRNSRLDAIQAAVLQVKLQYLDEWNRSRIDKVGFYNEAFADIAKKHGVELQLPELYKDGRHVYHLYTIRLNNREELVAFLKKEGIECAVHYPMALHQQEALLYLNVNEGTLPNAEKAGREVMSLPICPELTAANQQRVVETVAAFFKR